MTVPLPPEVAQHVLDSNWRLRRLVESATFHGLTASPVGFSDGSLLCFEVHLGGGNEVWLYNEPRQSCVVHLWAPRTTDGPGRTGRITHRQARALFAQSCEAH